MRAKLSSYVLVGIDAVPVDVIVDGDHVKVVATRSQRVLHSARQPALVAGRPRMGPSVYVPLRNLATADLRKRWVAVAGVPVCEDPLE
jgi:hypothetical protein